jgi:hypothetical protein
MTDPERIGRRDLGLAAQLLRSAADEQPSSASVQRTLAALGVSGVVLTTTGVAGAAVASSGAHLTTAASAGAGAGISAGAGKAVTAMLLVKWVGVGVVGGVGLAGAAAVVSSPAPSPAVVASAHVPRRQVPARVASSAASAPAASVVAPSPEQEAVDPPPVPRGSTSTPAPVPEASVDAGGVPLAAEVAFVDRARALLASGQLEAGLSRLSRYEREFPDARLLPEVLFLQLETYERLGQPSEARRAAQRLVSTFPHSPHAKRARALLQVRFP